MSWMIHNAFPSIASVAATLASVALLVVLSALTLAPLHKLERRSVVPFVICLVGIFLGALFTIYLIKHTIV